MITIDATPAQRLAAAAPASANDDAPAQTDHQRDLDALCERWVRWCATRRLFGPPTTLAGTLANLTTKTRYRRYAEDGPSAFCSAEMAALHVAYTCQPDALDKRVFDLYYVHRVVPIKIAADALGIGRQHFYTVLGEFRERIWRAAQAVMAENESQRLALRAGKVNGDAPPILSPVDATI